MDILEEVENYLAEELLTLEEKIAIIEKHWGRGKFLFLRDLPKLMDEVAKAQNIKDRRNDL